MKSKILLIVFAALGLVALAVVTAWRPFSNSASNNNFASQNSSSADANSAKEKNSVSTGSVVNNNSANVTKASVNGITAEITSKIEIYHGSPSVTLCTDAPSVADWLPHMSATYNGQQVNITGWGLVDPDSAVQSKHRCYIVIFEDAVIDPSHPSGKLLFSLDYFEMSLPEILPVDIIAKARDKLKTSGIDFEVQSVPHTQGIVITKKPGSVANDQALQAAEDAIAASTDKVYGPWTFVLNFNVSQP